jgi:peptide/nickel transport system permease protein
VAAFLSRRLAQLVPTLFFVSVIIFLLQQLLPGDPALVMAGEERDPAVLEQIRKQYRLDEPLPMQYLHWVKGVLTGDLGESMRIKRPVSELVLEKLPVTLQLASMAFVIALLIGIPAGVISAVRRTPHGTSARTSSRCGDCRRRTSGSASSSSFSSR